MSPTWPKDTRLPAKDAKVVKPDLRAELDAIKQHVSELEGTLRTLVAGEADPHTGEIITRYFGRKAADWPLL